MKDLTLMFVREVTKDGGLDLSEVGDGTTCCLLPLRIPADMAQKMLGRQVWISGGWGGPAKVEAWVPLPKAPQ